jgi:hypothetical protein
MNNVWDCEFCGQRVEIVNGKAKRPQTHYENCILKDHFIGDACMAFHDAKGAMRLLQAELFKAGKLVDASPLPKPYTLEDLVKYITNKRLPDQQPYTIMVGERIYNHAHIEKLARLLSS